MTSFDRLMIVGNWFFGGAGALFCVIAILLAMGAVQRRANYDFSEFVFGAIGTGFAGTSFLAMRWVMFG